MYNHGWLGRVDENVDDDDCERIDQRNDSDGLLLADVDAEVDADVDVDVDKYFEADSVEWCHTLVVYSIEMFAVCRLNSDKIFEWLLLLVL